jgi:hypothetical protein
MRGISKIRTLYAGLTLCALGGMAALPACSGAAAVSGETLNRYARAGEMYARGRFAETALLLEGTGGFPPALALRAKAEYFSGDLEKAENSCR